MLNLSKVPPSSEQKKISQSQTSPCCGKLRLSYILFGARASLKLHRAVKWSEAELSRAGFIDWLVWTSFCEFSAVFNKTEATWWIYWGMFFIHFYRIQSFLSFWMWMKTITSKNCNKIFRNINKSDSYIRILIMLYHGDTGDSLLVKIVCFNVLLIFP